MLANGLVIYFSVSLASFCRAIRFISRCKTTTSQTDGQNRFRFLYELAHISAVPVAAAAPLGTAPSTKHAANKLRTRNE